MQKKYIIIDRYFYVVADGFESSVLDLNVFSITCGRIFAPTREERSKILRDEKKKPETKVVCSHAILVILL